MKKIVLLISIFFAIPVIAQEESSPNDSVSCDYNRWSIEAMTGFSDGNYPYGNGFNPGDKKNPFSHFSINSFDVGLRYMMTPKFGFKMNLTYSKFSESDNSSIPYHTNYYNLAFQGVVNAARIFDFNPNSRIGLLLHAGIQVGSLTSKTENMAGTGGGQIPNPSYDTTEYHGGVVAGITPQFRITSNLAILLDLNLNFNYRQHLNWDGTTAHNENLNGKNTSLMLGLSYSLGKDQMHGDWKSIPDKNEQKVATLENKLDEIEVMMQDTDRDGVVDYLDTEPNTIGGVAVDTKGRAIDLNKNGIPDELEGRDGKRGLQNYDKDEEASFDNLITQGIVNVFFDTNIDTPNAASANNLYYLANYLKKYSEARVRVKGYADTTGDEKSNENLARRRAQKVTDLLIKSGINANRIEVLGLGVDESLDKSTKSGLQLARRVSFELVKN